VKSKNQAPDADCNGKFVALRKLGVRASFLFANFFLIITALYQLKPASRSLFIEALGAERLPYVWIVTALTMVVFITYYHRLVARHSRFNVVLGTCLVISGILVLFRFFINMPGPAVAVIWNTSSVGRGSLEYVLGSVDRRMDEFLNDWLKANPKEEPQTEPEGL